MVEDLLDHVLRDVPVDQAGSERVPPLVRSDLDRATVLVADVAALQPAAQGASVGAVADRRAPAGVRGWLREQRRRSAGPALLHCVLLPGDLPLQLLVDRDQRLAFHLVIAVAQVRSAGSIAGDAVPGQPPRIAETQPAADQDEGDQPAAGVVPAAEAGGVF